MNTACFSVGVLLVLLAAPARAQEAALPPGAYRTAAAYHRHQPQPGGTDAFYPDKRGQLVVVVPHGSHTEKLRVAPDSAWGYVSGKSRTVRFYRGQEYRLEFADTLCVYSSTTILVDGERTGSAVATPAAFSGQAVNTYAPRYFFSRGLNGFIFPLTPKYLREAYEASNPAFAAAVSTIRVDQSLADFDRKTYLFRVTTLYRQSAEKH